MSGPHETHVCRDCGAEITIPYARLDDIPDYGQQFASYGGRIHPDLERAIISGEGWPRDVPVPEPLTFREELRRWFGR